MIALLPLRGFAYASMPAMTNDGGVAVATAQAAAALPCHGAAALDDQQAGSDAQSCALCTLCHAAFAPPVAGGMVASQPLPSVEPAWFAIAGGRLDAEPLFKPPRG